MMRMSAPYMPPCTCQSTVSPSATLQVFVSSKDGTRVPMFVVHKKGLERNAQAPTLLYG